MKIEKNKKREYFIGKKKALIFVIMTIFLCRAICGNNKVEAAVCERIPKLSCKEIKMNVNARKKLKIRQIQQDAKVKWSSSDKNIVKVTRNGKVIAKKRGKAIIKIIINILNNKVIGIILAIICIPRLLFLAMMQEMA